MYLISDRDTGIKVAQFSMSKKTSGPLLSGQMVFLDIETWATFIPVSLSEIK